MFTTQKLRYDQVTVHLFTYSDVPVENYLDALFQDEVEQLKCFKNMYRQKEYIATRLLRTQLFGKVPIQYNEIGAPFIENEGYISISHTKEKIGIACCDDFQIGLDIEPIREKVLRVKHKFLSKKEQQELDVSSVEEVTKIWSGKEALYKLAGRKGIIFADSLLLSKKAGSLWKGEIVFPNSHRAVKMNIETHEDDVISVNCEPVSFL